MTVPAHLSTLEAVGLIRLAQAQPELEYSFRHTLVQEVAYDSLVKADRQTLHLAAGEALEQLYPDRRETGRLAPVLARHFHEAGDDDRALLYFRLAGDAATQVYAVAEAIVHYSQALELARRASMPIDRNRLLHLYSQRGRALELAGRFVEAEQNYRDLEAFGAQAHDRRLVMEGLIRRATLYAVPTARMDLRQGMAVAQEALRLARELSDRSAEVRSLWNLSNAAKFADQTREAIEYGEQAIAIAREHGLREQLALALNDIFSSYLIQRRFDQAMAAVNEAQRLLRELGNLPLLADSLTNAAQTHLFQGDIELGGRLVEEAHQISLTIGNLWGQSFSLGVMAFKQAEAGEMGSAIAALENCARLAHEAGFLVGQIFAPSTQAIIYAQLGDVDRGLALARQALTRADEVLPGYRPLALAALAQVRLSQGQVAPAERAITQARQGAGEGLSDATVGLERVAMEVELAKGDYRKAIRMSEAGGADLAEHGLRVLLPDLLRIRGLGHLGLGQRDQARAALEQALEVARELGLRRAVWNILTALHRLEREGGDAVRADAVRAEARQVVEFIAASLDSSDLRQKFLALPEVREVWET